MVVCEKGHPHWRYLGIRNPDNSGHSCWMRLIIEARDILTVTFRTKIQNMAVASLKVLVTGILAFCRVATWRRTHWRRGRYSGRISITVLCPCPVCLRAKKSHAHQGYAETQSTYLARICQFLSHFRLSSETFEQLVQNLGNRSEVPKGPQYGGREPIPVGKPLLIKLWLLDRFIV